MKDIIEYLYLKEFENISEKELEIFESGKEFKILEKYRNSLKGNALKEFIDFFNEYENARYEYEKEIYKKGLKTGIRLALEFLKDDNTEK